MDRFLRHRFQGLRGEDRINDGEYILLNARYGGGEIHPEAWSHTVFPGSKVNVSIIMESLHAIHQDGCPRTGRSGKLSDDRAGFRLW